MLESLHVALCSDQGIVLCPISVQELRTLAVHELSSAFVETALELVCRRAIMGIVSPRCLDDIQHL